MPHDQITFVWRGPFANAEIHTVHAEAFETRLFDESEWDWVGQCDRYSLGWVIARDGERFVGFVIRFSEQRSASRPAHRSRTFWPGAPPI